MMYFKMKKISYIIILTIVLNSGCATVFGGRITDCQRVAPKRHLRVVPFIVDILFFPVGLIGLAIDFSNGAIYQPCSK